MLGEWGEILTIGFFETFYGRNVSGLGGKESGVDTRTRLRRAFAGMTDFKVSWG